MHVVAVATAKHSNATGRKMAVEIVDELRGYHTSLAITAVTPAKTMEIKAKSTERSIRY